MQTPKFTLNLIIFNACLNNNAYKLKVISPVLHQRVNSHAAFDEMGALACKMQHAHSISILDLYQVAIKSENSPGYILALFQWSVLFWWWTEGAICCPSEPSAQGPAAEPWLRLRNDHLLQLTCMMQGNPMVTRATFIFLYQVFFHLCQDGCFHGRNIIPQVLFQTLL